MILKRLGAAATAAALLGLLSACAGSVAAPDTVVTALSATTKASLKIATVNADAAAGVAMTDTARNRILDEVKAEIAAKHPNIWVTASPAAMPGSVNLKIVFTRYDDGNAFARFMLAGLGQIHIDGDVIFTDASTGQQVLRRLRLSLKQLLMEKPPCEGASAALVFGGVLDLPNKCRANTRLVV